MPFETHDNLSALNTCKNKKVVIPAYNDACWSSHFKRRKGDQKGSDKNLAEQMENYLALHLGVSFTEM